MSNKKSNAKATESKNENVESSTPTEVVKTKSKGVGTLLTGSKNDAGKVVESTTGEKLAGVLKMLGDCELVRCNLAKQTVSNKCSKSGLKLRSMSNEDIEANEDITKARAILNKDGNFGLIKTCMKKESVTIERDEDGYILEDEDGNITGLSNDKFTSELREVYDTLLFFGRKDKVDSIPETVNF